MKSGSRNTYLSPATDLAASPLSTPQLDDTGRAALADPAAVPALAEKAAHLTAALLQNVASIEAEAQKGADRITEEARRHAPRGAVAAVTDALKQQAEARKAELRTKLLAESEATRTGVLKQLRAADEQAAALLSMWSSPVEVLARHELGSEQRSRYQLQLAGAGPSQLANFVRLAVATGDRTLGAALLDRIASMPKEHRPVSGPELAEALVGAAHKTTVAALKNVRLRFAEALEANRRLGGRRTNNAP